jgi:valyl-tRNA synthetase
LPGIEVYVDLAGLIDVAAERARLTREREKLLGLIEGKQRKLANANFTARAPADVVAKEREGLGELETRLSSIDRSLVELAKA